MSSNEGATQAHRRSILRIGAVGAVGAATVLAAASPAEAANNSLRPYLNTTLRKGSRGKAVKALQKALRMPARDQTGTFGSKTHSAVVAFQRKKRLRATGVVDNATWRAIGGFPTAAAEAKAKAAQAKAKAAARAKAEAEAKAKAEAAAKARAITQTVTLHSPLVPDISGCTSSPEWVLARRIALGSSYLVADEIKKVGMTAWLNAQFKPDTIPEPFLATVKDKYPGVWMTDKELEAYLPPPFSGVPINYVTKQLQHIHVLRYALTKRHLQTAMADFWLDFFSFPYNENKVFRYARDLDKMAREMAFKPFPVIYERFVASGAMWSYLDQRTSVKAHPGENLAREMMELHSVGVGHYTEADIKAAAKLLTGVQPGAAADGTVTYYVSEPAHYFGAVTIRGKKYANKAWIPGVGAPHVAADVHQFMLDLANDPLTVRRVCTRLAQRFVSDDPPTALITVMVAAWTASGGSIEKVLRAMFAEPLFYTTAGHKWRRPAELWASLAATAQTQWTFQPPKDNVFTEVTPVTFGAILAAGQPVRDYPSPAGMPESNVHWSGTSSLLAGFNFADMVLTGTDPHLSSPAQWAGRLGVSIGQSFEAAAVRIVERTTGFVVPADHVIIRTVMACLNGGPAPESPTAPLPNLTGMERAVQAAFNSPLMFLR